jgi:glycosyltransferase involved in cell wall biosynthesis
VTAVSVIVPARNASATIGPLLGALADQDLDEPYEVIVVDDGSTDGTPELAEAAGDGVRVIRESGLGPGPARNVGVGHSRGRALAFTDADCVPAPGWLREGLAALRDADLVQGAVRPDPSAARAPFDHSVAVGHEGGLYECASLFVDRDLFERLGGFEDWLPVRVGKPLAEDIWFGWRARRSGARTAFCERAVVEHAVIPRGPAGFLVERMRVGYFPAIVARVPELRERLLYRRWFLTGRSAAFDAALAGAALATGRRSPWPLVLAIPYARLAIRSALPWGRRAPLVAAVEGTADAIGFAVLVAGSLRRRTPVL